MAQDGIVIIMLVGPIDYWWNENWNTEQHLEYRAWRTEVSRQLVEAGHLVYRPHEAFKGAWDERAQKVNDAAIQVADFLINLNPGVPAYGTEREIAQARWWDIPVLHIPPGTSDAELRLLQVPVGPWPRPYIFDRLEDPYGKVHRKSYSKR